MREKRNPIACLDIGLIALLAVALIAAPASVRSEPSGIICEELIEFASGGACQEPRRMNESVFHFVDDVTVRINKDGVVGVAWADHSRKDIFFLIWHQAVPVSPVWN